MRKYLLLWVCLLAISAQAQAVNFRATLDRSSVSVGERFRVTFSLDDNGSDFQGPKFSGFKVLGGPNQSTQMSYVNGQMTRSLSMSYVLVAIKEGSYTIGPATITSNGKTIKSNSLKIDVLPESEAAKKDRERKETQEQSMTEQARDIIKKNLFVKLSVNKTNVYQGEPLTAVYKIYRHPELQLSSLSAENAPVFNGFWTQEFDIRDYDWQVEEVNGVRFLSAVVKKVVLVPQQTGKLKIEPFRFDCTAQLQVQNSQRERRSFFDDPFFSRNSYRSFDYLASSGSQTINVKPLPEGAPSSFTGTVGNVEMETWFDVTETKTGEPVTLKIRISGNGNLKMMEAPIVNFPPDFEVYDPKLSDNTTVTASTISGNILYEYLALPRNPGEYKVGPVEFCYFDLAKDKYVTLKSDEFVIKVAKGEGGAMQNFSAGSNKEDIEILNSDIKYIKTKTSLSKKSSALFGSPLFIVAMLLPFVLLLLLLLLRKKYQHEAQNQAGVRNRKAAKIAKKRLALAGTLLKSNDRDRFYEELIKALWGYLGDKLSIPTSNLTKDNVAEVLAKFNVPENISSDLLNTLEQCEFARYAPQGSGKDYMHETYTATEKLIISIEGIL